MSSLMDIEKKAGRVRQEINEYSSRPLDIDIIFFNNLIINTDFIQIPHPRYRERKFVLLPIIEIQQDLSDPSDLKHLSEILVLCGDNSEIKKLEALLVY